MGSVIASTATPAVYRFSEPLPAQPTRKQALRLFGVYLRDRMTILGVVFDYPEYSMELR